MLEGGFRRDRVSRENREDNFRSATPDAGGAGNSDAPSEAPASHLERSAYRFVRDEPALLNGTARGLTIARAGRRRRVTGRNIRKCPSSSGRSRSYRRGYQRNGFSESLEILASSLPSPRSGERLLLRDRMTRGVTSPRTLSSRGKWPRIARGAGSRDETHKTRREGARFVRAVGT